MNNILSQAVNQKSIRITFEATRDPGQTDYVRDQIVNVDNNAANRLANHQPVNPLGTVGYSDDVEKDATRKVPSDVPVSSVAFPVGPYYKPRSPFD